MSKVSIGSAQRPARGERVCGDGFVVVEHDDVTILAVADGLGHGPKAAEASEAFCAYVQEHPDEPVEPMILGAHGAITGTRGVAGAILRIDESADRLDFVGVGNIEVRAISAEPIRPVSTPGVVGGNLRRTRPFDYRLTPGDLLVVFSDGISRSVEPRKYQHLGLTEMAEMIVEEKGKDHDDVTCVIVRYG